MAAAAASLPENAPLLAPDHGELPKLAKMIPVEVAMRLNTVWPAECEVPAARNVINGALLMKTLPTEAMLHELAHMVVARFARLRAVAGEDGEWQPVDVEAMDFGYHVNMEPPVGQLGQLAEAVDRLGEENLDVSKPLWRFHCIPCTDAHGYAALVMRVHHCIGDGVHLSQILMELCRKEDGSRVDTNAAQAKFEAMLNGGNVVARACRSVGKAVASVPAFGSTVIAPMKPLEANSVWQRPAEDRKAGSFPGKRVAIMVPPHSLEFVKECKNKAKVTVNDVLMGATAGAIRRYCESREDPLFTKGVRSKAKMRVLVPVALPKQFPDGHDETDKLTNHWSFVSIKLPAREATPLERVKATKREMDSMKRSAKPFVGLWMLDKVVPKLPVKKQQETARDLFANHGLVFSNVPGPQEPLFVGGVKLEGAQLVYYNAIPQIILCTIAGKVWMNITVDPEIVTDRECFIRCYFEELEELGRELGVTASVRD